MRTEIGRVVSAGSVVILGFAHPSVESRIALCTSEISVLQECNF